MFPWLWLWTPQVHFPLSGAVTQTLDYYARIPPEAGKGDTERQAANTVSYGRQLDALTEVLLSIKAPDMLSTDKADKALEKLRKNYVDIEQAKALEAVDLVQSIAGQLDQLRLNHPEAYQALLKAR